MERQMEAALDAKFSFVSVSASAGGGTQEKSAEAKSNMFSSEQFLFKVRAFSLVEFTVPLTLGGAGQGGEIK
jgi:hypothetical protein